MKYLLKGSPRLVAFMESRGVVGLLAAGFGSNRTLITTAQRSVECVKE
jgi:hypothetical protein